MARSRNLKPGFFKNEQLAELPPITRLLFAGLWLLADREGRLENRPKRIKAEVLPYDNCDVAKELSALHAGNFITCYEVDSQKYIYINNFVKHQNPHCKEPASSIPEPDKNSERTVLEPLQHRSRPADSLNPLTDSLNPLTLTLPPNLSPEKWKEWVEYRKERKLKTASQTWKKQITLLASDPNPGAVIDRTITNGWQGLEYALTPKNGGKPNGTRHEHLASVAAKLTGNNANDQRTYDAYAVEVDREIIQPLASDVRQLLHGHVG